MSDWNDEHRKNRKLFEDHDKKLFDKYGINNNKDSDQNKNLNNLNNDNKEKYHDPTIDEVTDNNIYREKSIHDIEKAKLSDDDIKRAKQNYSPEGITKLFPNDIANVGSLFNYKLELGPDGTPVRIEDENGDFHNKLLLDKNNQPIINKEAKWDKNIELDIRLGLESFDTLKSGLNQRESFSSAQILDNPTLNKLYDLIMKDISDSDAHSINDMMIVQYENFGLVRFSQGPHDWFNQRLLYKSTVDPLITLIKSKAGMKIRQEDSRSPQTNGSIIYINNENKHINFRVATGASQYGMFIVLRRQGATFNSLDELDLPDVIKSDFRRAISGKDGLTFVGGPVGSGKTTLMTTGLIERLQQTNGGSNIISLEKPIETPTPGIVQEDIDDKYNMDWSNGIQSALREMPTILRVGEVNERQAARAIVRAANSGIVALSTMHIRSTLEVFETLKDYDISENEIKNALRLVIYLNRVPKLCPHCRIIKSIIGHNDIKKWSDSRLNDGRSGALSQFAERNPEGCNVCRQTQRDKNLYGTLGKVGIFELLRVNKPFLMIWRRYQNDDLYVLKDKLLHPETIRIENKDAVNENDKFVKLDDSMLSGLDYHPIEEDVLAKLRNYDIDINTGKYLLNE